MKYLFLPSQVIASVLIAVGAFLAAGPLAAQTGELRPMEPVVCSGSKDVLIEGRLIETAGDAVNTRGSCDITIRNSHIIAGGVGVMVSSSGDVLITDSTIEGGEHALKIRGSGEIEFGSSVIIGGTRNIGSGDLIDLGGNSFERGSPGTSTRRSERREAPGATPDDRVVIGPGGIRAGGVEITADGIRTPGADIDLRDGDVHIESGGASIHVDDDGWVRLGTGSDRDDNWRERRSSYSRADNDRILVELGAERSDEGRMALTLAGDVLFEFDSARVQSAATPELRKVAHLLRQQAEVVWVIGHTDSLGSVEYNQKLSEARAVAVMRWLNANEGVPYALMRARGRGAHEPIAHNTAPNGDDDPAGRARNRRVEIQYEPRL